MIAMPPRAAFTLLELILVLAIIAVGAAVAAARLTPLRGDRALALAAHTLAAQVQRCQDLAAAHGHPVRLRLDRDAGTIEVAVIGSSADAPGDGADARLSLAPPPDRVAVAWRGADGVLPAAGPVDLLFLPDRRCDHPGTVTLELGSAARTVRIPAAARPPVIAVADPTDAGG